MESVLLGLAAPAAVGTAGSLLERTLQTAAGPFAALLQAFTSAMPVEGEESAPAMIESFQDKLESLRSELAAEIENALSIAGIDLTNPITIRISQSDGHLEVAGEHPQKTLIEAALADSPGLTDKFTEVAALQQLLAATDKLDDADLIERVTFGEADRDTLTAVFTAGNDGASLTFN